MLRGVTILISAVGNRQRGRGGNAPQAAMREVKEEVTIDVVAEQLTLIDCQRTVEFEIFHIYVIAAPGCVITESWSSCAYRALIVFTEHLALQVV